MLEIVDRAWRFFTPKNKLYEQEEANWVKIQGGRNLGERIAEYKLRRDNLLRDLSDLKTRVKPLYPRRVGVIVYSEVLIGQPFYSLVTNELHLSRKFPFLRISTTDLVSVSLGNIPSLGTNPNLLPATSWSAAVERDHTGYVQCDLYERSISGWVHNVIENFANRHGYPVERVFFNERYKNPSDTQKLP